MKKPIFFLMVAGLFTFASCETRNENTQERTEDRAEETADDIEDAADEVGDDVEKAAEEIESK